MDPESQALLLLRGCPLLMGYPIVLPACSGLLWSRSLGFPSLSVLGPHGWFYTRRGDFCLERQGLCLCPGHWAAMWL